MYSDQGYTFMMALKTGNTHCIGYRRSDLPDHINSLKNGEQYIFIFLTHSITNINFLMFIRVQVYTSSSLFKFRLGIRN
jgi:hypothetical protein